MSALSLSSFSCTISQEKVGKFKMLKKSKIAAATVLASAGETPETSLLVKALSPLCGTESSVAAGPVAAHALQLFEMHLEIRLTTTSQASSRTPSPRNPPLSRHQAPSPLA